MKRSILTTNRGVLGVALLAATATTVFAQQRDPQQPQRDPQQKDVQRETLPPSAEGVVAEDLDEANARFRKSAVEAFRKAAGQGYVLPDTSATERERQQSQPPRSDDMQKQPGMQDKDAKSTMNMSGDFDTVGILISSFPEFIVVGAPLHGGDSRLAMPSGANRPNEGSQQQPGERPQGDRPQPGDNPRESAMNRAREIGGLLITRPGTSLGFHGISKPETTPPRGQTGGGSFNQIGPVAAGFYKVRLSDGHQSAELVAADGTVALRVPLKGPPFTGLGVDREPVDRDPVERRPEGTNPTDDKRPETNPADERAREGAFSSDVNVNHRLWAQVYAEILAMLETRPGRT